MGPVDGSMLAVVLAGCGVGLAAWVVLSQVERKATIRASLRRLDGYEVENVRDRDLLVSVTERALVPMLGALTGLGRRFTPVGYIERSREKFLRSGALGSQPVDRFLAVRAATVAAIPLVLIAVYVVWAPGGMMAHGAAAFGCLALALGPDSMLNRRVEERQAALRSKLPDVMDLLVISVEAGLGFEQALDRTVAAVPGPLTDEFSRMLGQVRAGASRADALRALDQRTNLPEIRSFVLAILQADAFGVSIGSVLRSQAEEMRIKRRQLAQEQAQKAPVKMLIPMVFLVFPALFVVILGPAMINISQTL